MKMNEGVMSEINMLVNDYKDFCDAHGREPTLQKCFAFVKAKFGNAGSFKDRDLFQIVKNQFVEEIEPALGEAMEVVKSFGYRILREAEEDVADDEPEEDEDAKNEAFLADFEPEIANLITELAEYTGNEVTDAEVTENSGINGDAVTVSFGREEYECYNDYDKAEEAAKEDVKSLIDDCGGVIQSGINFNNLGGRDQYIDEYDAKKIVKEDLENMLSDMSNREKRENYGSTDDDEIIEDQLGQINSYVDYIVDNWGEEQLDNLIEQGYISFDLDKLAQDCVDADGVAQNLARYDGEEIELDGWWAYRVD